MVSWSIASGPLTDIDSAGIATADTVYQNTAAVAQGEFEGMTGQLSLTVLDTHPDNFGSYADDGLDDDWQFQFFGLNNPSASPTVDADGDGQNNHFEFVAGVIPTDPLSRFQLEIHPVPGQPTHRDIVFNPRLEDRSYTVTSKQDLAPGTWLPLTSSNSSDILDVRAVTDLDAEEPVKFYRVEITQP